LIENQTEPSPKVMRKQPEADKTQVNLIGLTCEPAVRSKERTRTPCKGVKPAQFPQNLRDFVQKVLR